MIPNIDGRGRKVRAVCGTVLLVVSLWQAITLPRPWGLGLWVAVLGPALGGVFMLFEARKGWCAIRACRLKPPL